METSRLLSLVLALLVVFLSNVLGQPLESGSGICHLTCKGENDLVSDPFDCGSYYRCGAGVVEHRFCPSEKPYFSIVGCNTDASLCCKPSCIPVCSRLNTTIPDPKNCSNYYVCQETGTPAEKSKKTCNSGSYFDIALGQCSSDAKCQTLCQESVTETFPTAPTTSETIESNPTDTIILSTTTIETATIPDCHGNFTCPAVGYFPKCRSCQPEYYRCYGEGQQGQEQRCSGTLVFNIDPAVPYCVLPSECNAYV